MQADLIIVGAGMVGSTLALALQNAGLSIRLIDAGPLEAQSFASGDPFEPRVSALSAASQRILERVGAWQGMVDRRVSPYLDMHVWDGSGTGRIDRRIMAARRPVPLVGFRRRVSSLAGHRGRVRRRTRWDTETEDDRHESAAAG